MRLLLIPLILALTLNAPAAAQRRPLPEWRQAREEQVLLRLNAIEPRVIRLRAGVPARLAFFNETRTRLSVDLGGLLAGSNVREGDRDGVSHGRLRIEAGDTRVVTLVPRAGRYRIRSGNWIRRFIGMSALVIVEDAPGR